MKKIPVFVLSGFLGSGKTTLLVDIIKKARDKGLSLSVLMNEAGKTDTDGRLISELDGDLPVEKLLDGCMCCNKKSEVSGAVMKLAETNPDMMVMELTGIADPEEVADALAEPELMEHIELKKVISVLDGENILDYNSIFTAERAMVKTTRKQIAFADALIVNKEDQMDENSRKKIKRVISKENSVAPVTFTSYCQVDLDELLFNMEGERKPFSLLKEEKNTDEHTHSRIQTLKIEFTKPVKSKRAAEALFKELKPGLIRAKGYISVKREADVHLIQHVVKKTYWEKAQAQEESYLILIGLELDKGYITSRLNELIVNDC
ncbi:GTP-binding protein [Bacillus sp. H-16]|uniref:CobW family GTP-binding protein n=1 Tax=Alteribacter salitolerans TaxID=2912333 RepID=UPI0019640F01|nr:CobW family GTP-binding protein [Alteribacter salitolerans]MBM7095253.1 GTP-binding protein [Alteribacter salitolerans]